jgi:electron transport complex protein RnfD
VAATGDTPAVTVEQALADADVDLWKLSLGNVRGSLGEVSVIALLLGAVLMLLRRVISWHIPVSYLGTLAAITGLMWIIDPDRYASPLFHVVSGGLVLGAFYMATDMVTSPVTRRGMLIFGAGCGLITATIRLFGAFPEGVSFAILIMNGFVPLIERKIRPRKFGEVKARKGAKADG